MTLLICVILVFLALILLLMSTQDSKTTTVMAARLKKVKCPRCRKHFDPNPDVILNALSFCKEKKCGLELVNVHKLRKRFGYPTKDEQLPYIIVPPKDDDIVVFDVDEPMEIHVVDATTKYVA